MHCYRGSPARYRLKGRDIDDFAVLDAKAEADLKPDALLVTNTSSLPLTDLRADLKNPAQAQRTITDIAFSWGFNNGAHFSRVFREHTGLSPSDFRETALRQTSAA